MHYGKCGSGEWPLSMITLVEYYRKSLRKMTCIVVNGPCAGDRKRRPHTNLIAGDKKVMSESCNILKSERMSDVN